MVLTMTSCSYYPATTASLKRAVCFQLQFHHHSSYIKSYRPNKRKDVDVLRISASSASRLDEGDAKVPNEEKHKIWAIKKVDGEHNSISYSTRTLTRPMLGNNFGLPHFYCDTHVFLLPSSSSSDRIVMDVDMNRAGHALCSPTSYRLENLKYSHENLKSAPNTLNRNLSADISCDKGIPVESVTSRKKGGESSWATFCEFTSARISRIFHAVYNHQRYRDFLIKRRKTMSLSLLLDPIVGSPPSPSNLTSPIVEARDDISALSEGFKRKVIFRRRLSTSFDEPASIEDAKGKSVTNIIGRSVEHAGPFAFKGPPKKVLHEKIDEDDSADKRAKLNSWLAQLHEEALAKAESSGSGDDISDTARGNDGANDNDSGSGNRSRPTSPAAKPTEDLFELLEKVIGFKGRNVSHITVEQSVKDLCTVYMDVDDEDKTKFFVILAEKYGVDHEYVSTCASNLAACKDAEVRLTLEEKLRTALIPKSQWLFTQVGRLENGVKFLVDFRTDLLDAIERSKGKSSLKALNNSLRDLIGMWFNVGFLNLERVTWQSSCEMLQKISEYEAVHPMRNWTDLKKRVGPNRRCFVYTHNSMPGEPVVVLHTFLTDHIASSVKKIVANHRMRMMSLDSDLPMNTIEDPDFISTAIFYSITSTQRGLTGIELGNYLIKRVVRELQSEFPKMTQYSSLSPIPGFTRWLVSSVKNAMKDPSGGNLFTESELNALKPIFAKYSSEERGTAQLYDAFLKLLKLNAWFSDENLVKELERPLMRLCAQYLYVEKRRGYALDPVAHFHLKNGAVIWRLNWLGDDSPKGLGQSCGMMVNYRYFLDDCETNSQNYLENQVIQVSDQVKHLAKCTESKL